MRVTALGFAVAVATACAGFPVPALAAPTVKLDASLQPDRLGASTTVSIGFQIAAGASSPLTTFDVRLPPEMGLAASTLGVATCSNQTLLEEGPAGCSPNAVMGSGSALAESAFGAEVIRESAPISVFMGQPTNGHTTLLYYFDGRVPVIAPLVFPSQFVSDANSARSEFDTAIPTVAALPGAPDVAIRTMHANIGPRDLRYVRHVGKRIVTYKPISMAVPTTCPRGGFPFSAVFGFQDGARVTVQRVVPCPR